jgi:hypothetical protein
MGVAITGSSLGVELAFDVAPELVERFRALLPPGWSAGPVDGAARRWRVDSAHDLAAVQSAAELHVAELAPGLVAIHAGVVAFGAAAVLLPGRSLSGKSTLTAELVRAGATYYSDEFALLDVAGQVLPYPRPISLRAPVQQVRPATVGTGAARVELVATLRYLPDADWAVDAVGAGRGTLDLIDNAVAAQTRPEEVLAHCAAAARSARFLRGVRGPAAAAAAQLRAALARP